MRPIFATQNHVVSCYRIQMPFYDDEKYAFVSIRQDSFHPNREGLFAILGRIRTRRTSAIRLHGSND